MIVEFSPEFSVARPGGSAVPERRRVVVIGADAAGLTAALHLGEHCLLIDERGEVGGGGHHAEELSSHGAGTSAWERREIIRACSLPNPESPEEQGPTVIARWIPPRLDATEASDGVDARSLRSLVPLLRGELRLDSRVVRIHPSDRKIEMEDGRAIVYDKLVCSIPVIELISLLRPDLPDRVRSHQALLYWLAARDIEMLDADTRALVGDVDAFVAGRRVADYINCALAIKFRPRSEVFFRGEKLFRPRVVVGTSATVHR